MRYWKKVGFNNLPKIALVPSKYEENRSINLRYLRPIMQNIDNASLELAELINKFSKHKILQIDEDDIPIKVKDERFEWFNDVSGIMLVNMVKRNMNAIVGFIREFNNQVEKKIDANKSGKVIYKSCIFGVTIEAPFVVRNFIHQS